MTEFAYGITKRLAAISAKDQAYQLENSQKPKNKDAIRKLEDELDKMYSEIIQEFGPSIGYLYLKAQGFYTSDRLRTVWQKSSHENSDTPKYVGILKELEFADQPISLDAFPKCSFSIRIDFKLSKPYISRNDEDFYVIDNPIVRDKVFRIPMVRPSGWKGALSGALYQLELTSDREFVKRVFGEVKESGDEEKIESGTAGRMHIYPSFFLDAKTGVEVINPRERKSQAGTKPIPFEVVKQGSSSTFSMLYVPFDCIGKNDDKTISDIQKDVRNLLQGIQGMFRIYGFGAKTSSGFGTAEDACKVEIRIKGGKVPILATNFSELKSEQKIKEVTDSIQKGGE